MTAAIIYNSGSTQHPFSVAATVAEHALKSHAVVILLDVEDFAYIHQGLPPKWIARTFGHSITNYSLEQHVLGLGAEYIRLVRRKGPRNPPALDSEAEEELTDSIESDLYTLFHTDRLTDNPIGIKLIARKMRRLVRQLFPELRGFLEERAIQEIYVPNGRVAHQRISALAGKKSGCKVSYYEIGRAIPDSAYIGSCQIHDRESTQQEARDFGRGRNKKIIRKQAEQWLENRMAPGSQLNQFSTGWAATTGDNYPKSCADSAPDEAIFFTSSADEFSSYGNRWANHEWIDQFDAFRTILPVLLTRNVKCSLRVHPNLANKGRKHFSREVASVLKLQEEFPSLKVIWHNDPINSYDLLRKSHYVFVGRSTIGLEASLMGKCVWTTTPARYDEIADVRKLHRREDVTEQALQIWPAKPDGAEIFIAYWASQDYPFTLPYSTWCSWNMNKPPWSMKAAQILVRNPLVYKIEQVKGEIFKFRNKRMRFERS